MIGKGLKRNVMFAVLAWVCGLSVAQGGTTERVNVTSTGAQLPSQTTSAIYGLTANGRFVVFSSTARIIPEDNNNLEDVYLRDLATGTVERISIGQIGLEADGSSGLTMGSPISADGRYVVFTSMATNLIPGRTLSRLPRQYVFDRISRTTELVSVSFSGGDLVDGWNPYTSISANGRYIVFSNRANNFVANDVNGKLDIFIRDRVNKTTQLISMSSTGEAANSDSQAPEVSADGRYVVFDSMATNLVPGNTVGSNVFIRDMVLNATKKVIAGNSPQISSDGHYVMFTSSASNLVPDDTNNAADVFYYDTVTEAIVRVSVTPDGRQANGSSVGRQISQDGRYVLYTTYASNILDDGGPTNGALVVFDRVKKVAERVSVSSTGQLMANMSGFFPEKMSADGRVIAFESSSPLYVPNDTNNAADIFVRDRAGDICL